MGEETSATEHESMSRPVRGRELMRFQSRLHAIELRARTVGHFWDDGRPTFAEAVELLSRFDRDVHGSE